MTTVPQNILDTFVAACRQAAQHGLMKCSSGNMSWRIDDRRMLVSTSRSWLGRLTTDDVAICAMDDGRVLNSKRASVETGFHLGILKARPDINVVLHYQTSCATALACRNTDNINFFVIPEIPFYIGPVARIPYFPPGSKELADAVIRAMRSHDLLIMGNHGQVTVAKDFDHAIQNAEFFELACDVILRCGDKVIPLPEAEANALLASRQAANAKV